MRGQGSPLGGGDWLVVRPLWSNKFKVKFLKNYKFKSLFMNTSTVLYVDLVPLNQSGATSHLDTQSVPFRLDVMGKDLPKNFLGTAFEISIAYKVPVTTGFSAKNPSEFTGESTNFLKNWAYQKFELSADLNNPEKVLSLATFKTNPARVVFGLTFKQGSVITFKDGKIVSFYLSLPKSDLNQNLLFHFDRKVLSVFDAGRKDLSAVSWQDGQFDLVSLLGAQVVQPQKLQDSPSKDVQSKIAVEAPAGDGSVVAEPAGTDVSDPLATLAVVGPTDGIQAGLTSHDLSTNLFDPAFIPSYSLVLTILIVLLLVLFGLFFQQKLPNILALIKNHVKKD
jgi:hypothetical protein